MSLDQDFLIRCVPQARIEGRFEALDGTWRVDSRVIEQGNIFVALAGEHHDGHDFVSDAFARGAQVCIVKKDRWDKLWPTIRQFLSERACIIVPDPLAALLAWATAWRAQFSYPVIGVTGSVGKTTTKEYIAHIFRAQGRSCLASQGNQNTLIGISLNILRMRSSHSCAVFEMGINRHGEMKDLVKLVRPTTGVITAIGHSHMEGLGSLADIAGEKRHIFDELQRDGIGFINGDQAILANIAYEHPVIKFGLRMVNQVQARQVNYRQQGIACVLKIYRERVPLVLPTENGARLYHALAAAAVTHYFGVPVPDIVTALQQSLEIPGRFQKRFFGARKQHMIIDDSCNASPESMKAALASFERLEAQGKKIAILGDMLEMGINAPFWHRQLGRMLKKTSSLDHVILVGNHVQWTSTMLPHVHSFEICATWQDAVAAVGHVLENEPACILVKGSYGVGLGNLVRTLVEKI